MSTREQALPNCSAAKVSISNELLQLTILPDVGGKILDLVDRRSGRNWLWRNPGISPRRPRGNADYNRDQDSGGWDEVLLSLHPETLELEDGRVVAVPDHGDLIGRPWSVETLATRPGEDAVCEMSAAGCEPAYRFRRTVRLPHGQALVSIDYEFENTDTVPLPLYWCAHCLLAVAAGARIGIDGEPPLHVDSEAARERCAATPQRWPQLQLRDGDRIDLAAAFEADQAGQWPASKVFVASPANGRAAVSLPGGSEKLVFGYDPAALPWLGLWINNRAWAGNGSAPYLNLGIEPSTAARDSLGAVLANGGVPWLMPGETKTWQLRIEVYA